MARMDGRTEWEEADKEGPLSVLLRDDYDCSRGGFKHSICMPRAVAIQRSGNSACIPTTEPLLHSI